MFRKQNEIMKGQKRHRSRLCCLCGGRKTESGEGESGENSLTFQKKCAIIYSIKQRGYYRHFPENMAIFAPWGPFFENGISYATFPDGTEQRRLLIRRGVRPED